MKTISRLLLICSIFTFYTPAAYAYLDPGTGSYLIQVVAGAILATGAGIAYYWKKIINRLRGKNKNDEE